MTTESFFSHPTLEGFNIVLDDTADSDGLLAAARKLVVDRFGIPEEAWTVATVGPIGNDGLDSGPGREIDLTIAGPHLERLLADERTPITGAGWETSYELAELPGVVSVEPLWLLTQDDFVDDSQQSDLRRLVPPPSAVSLGREDRSSPTDVAWSPIMLEAPAAWSIEPPNPAGRSRGATIRVGHPDSGYLPHQELTFPEEPSDRFLEELGRDLVDGDRLKNEDGTHGTGTASVLMSWDRPDPTANRTVMGVAPAAEIVPYRVTRRHAFVPSPVLFWSGARRLRDAIYLAVDQGCHVISISLGWWKNDSLHRAVRYAVEHDVIVVAAAGNYVRKVVWPAAYPEVIAVAGCTHDRRRWSGSCRGDEVDITGPAADVYRAAFVDGVPHVEPGDGTSFATASVAGLAALWLAHHGRDHLIERYEAKRPLADVFAELLASSADPPPTDHNGKFGAGIANGRRLVESNLPDANAVDPSMLPTEGKDQSNDLAALESDLHVTDAAGRMRLARSLSVQPQDLPTDLDGMTDELLFHVITDPQRRETAFGVDHLEVGEVEDGLVRTSEPVTTASTTPRTRPSKAIAPPPLSRRLANHLGAGPGPDRG